MKIGEQMVVRRSCTPATGYEWYVSALTGGIVLLGSSFEGTVTVPGQSVIKVFTFLAVSAGPASIQFALCRPFSPIDILYDDVFPVEIDDTGAVEPEHSFMKKVGEWGGFKPCLPADADIFRRAVQLTGVVYEPVCVASQASSRRYLFAVNGLPAEEHPHAFSSFIEIVFSGSSPQVERIIPAAGSSTSSCCGFGAFKKIGAQTLPLFEHAAAGMSGFSFAFICSAVRVVAGSEYLVLANEKRADKEGLVYPVMMTFRHHSGGPLELTDVQKVYTL